MRSWKAFVPMMTLLLLMSCVDGNDRGAAELRLPYQEMTGCEMEATVRCTQDGAEWEGDLCCGYVPGGESWVEVLAPEIIAGVCAVFSDTDWRLEYEGDSLNAGTLSGEAVSPALCLPRLMSALSEGWLLEENRENWGEEACVRLTLDQSGDRGGKLVSTLWLREADGTPLRGELAVDGENILTAEFTKFAFYDTIDTTDSPPQS